MDSFEQKFNELRELVDASLLENVWKEGLYNSRISQAMRYALFGKSKRLRPVLSLLVTEAVGGDIHKILRAACSVEVIHTASLIFDDLPCMDNAAYRRNQPTVHRVFGEDIAILAAVGLHVHAVELLTSNCLDLKVDSSTLIQLNQGLCRAIGKTGLIYGQEADLGNLPENASAERLCFIHEHKTAALFVFAAELACILLSLNEDDRKALVCFSREVGFIYQIMDDFLDANSSSEKLGKDIRKDAAKATYVSLIGAEKARKEWQERLHNAENCLRNFSGDSSVLFAYVRHLTRLFTL